VIRDEREEGDSERPLMTIGRVGKRDSSTTKSDGYKSEGITYQSHRRPKDLIPLMG
jgi:hypothetical protein